MKTLSAFDILGPVMVGPSSSHTAGALRISSFVYKIANDKIKNVKFTLYGSFAHTYKGHGSDKALVAGILGFNTDDLQIRNSFEIAKSEGILFEFVADDVTKTEHPNTILVEASTISGQKISIIGESIGGGAAKIVDINGVKVNFTGEYHTVLIEQNDEKGVVADITAKISEKDINIAFMRVFRHEKGGTAYTIIETDGDIEKSIVSELLECKNVRDVSIISI